MKVERSDGGWLYGFDFRTLEIKDDHAGGQPFVRRRRWFRRVESTVPDDDVCEDDDAMDNSQSASGEWNTRDDGNASETMSVPSQSGRSAIGTADFEVEVTLVLMLLMLRVALLLQWYYCYYYYYYYYCYYYCYYYY